MDCGCFSTCRARGGVFQGRGTVRCTITTRVQSSDADVVKTVLDEVVFQRTRLIARGAYGKPNTKGLDKHAQRPSVRAILKPLEFYVTRVKSLTTLHLSFQLFAQTGHNEKAQGLDAS